MADTNLQHRAKEVAEFWRSVRAIAGDDDQTVIDTVDGETDAISALRRTVQLAIEADAHAEAAKTLAASYMERRRVLEDRSERYRLAVACFLQEVGEKSVRLPEATVSWRNAGPQVIGDYPSAADLPDSCVKFQRVRHEPSIREALERGERINGLSLSNGGVALAIRRA